MTDAIQFDEKADFTSKAPNPMMGLDVYLTESGKEMVEKLLELQTLSGYEMSVLGKALLGPCQPAHLRAIAQSHISELTSCPASPNSTT